MDKYIGKRLEGRYDILELIGKGGMANVYRAHDAIDDRTVAVKILRDEYMNNADFVRRFKNESKAIALLNHPNIVRVYDVSFSDVQSIVMEYIDGVTLKEYMDHTGALPWKDAVHFSIQILHALQHAHDKGIVHRDIKPQNIMLLQSGEIKVTDFGIARFARSESRTISDRAIGSVHYISPEQALGENTDDKSDIYSTGIMLYEMLTGCLPFEADTAISVAMKQIQTPIKKPTEINPEIPVGLEEITLRAVQKDSRARYQSAAEMIAALEEFRKNPNIRFGYSYSSPANRENGSSQSRGKTDMGTQSAKKLKKKRSPYLRIMLLVTIAIALGSAGFIGLMVYMSNPFEKTPEAILPNMIGQKVTDAQTVYPDFVIQEEARQFSDEYAKGVVMEQKPKSGISVKIGSAVKVVVSDGRREIEVPDVVDMPSARVMDSFRDLGLEPEVTRRNHETLAVGRVISTDPPMGTVLSGGDKITLYVSEGPERKLINVPDIVGMSQESATASLEQQGFLVGSVTEKASDLPDGTVISQTPAAGALENQGAKVNLVISKQEFKRFYISVPLPQNMNRDVTIRARVGTGDTPAVAAEDLLNPSQSATGIWAPSFVGDEGETLRVIIYIDGVLYQEYELDFSDGSHTVVRDRSTAAEFQK